MSAEGRLQALERLVTVMQSEVILARTAAAQAEQRATDAETRVLGVRGAGVVDAAGKTKELRRYDERLETVQVYVLGLCWCSGFVTQASDDRKRSFAGNSNHELSLACQRPASLNAVVQQVGTALGGISAVCWNMQAMVKGC